MGSSLIRRPLPGWAPWPVWKGCHEYWETYRRELKPWIALRRRQTEHGWRDDWFYILRFGNEVIFFPVASQSFLTTPTGSNQTTTLGVDATWNNGNNTAEVIGGGGSGGAGCFTTRNTSGGGGAEYGKATNFQIANPGTTTFTWQVGAGGASVSSVLPTSAVGGNNGGDTWLNGTTQAASTIGADRGGGGTASVGSSAGGSGGTGGVGAFHFAGGNGGTGNASGGTSATGGGGAGGPIGAGLQGGDTTTSGTATAGGDGDSSAGGDGGPGQTSGLTGNNGTAGAELGDNAHGSGGGGGGLLSTSSSGGAITAGSGGLYGAGGGSAFNTQSGNGTTANSGAGKQGLIVLTWGLAPPSGTAFPGDTMLKMFQPLRWF